MITKAFVILLVLYLPVCAMLIIAIWKMLMIAIWKIDERVLKLEALVKCLESETRALRRKTTLKDGEE
jgi:hypothetical protein